MLRNGRQLKKDRSALPDVPAVYFVEPTSDNVKRICEVIIWGYIFRGVWRD